MNLEENFDEAELTLINVNFLGLKKKPYGFKRGARTSQKYVDPNDLNGDGEPKLTIEEVYNNVWSSDGRRLEAFTRRMDFYKEDGVTIWFSIDTTPEIDDVLMEEIMESVWKRQIRYLKVAAENLDKLADTLPEPLRTQYKYVANSVTLIMDHYENEIPKYESHGSRAFEDAVNSEEDPEILQRFKTPVKEASEEFPNGMVAKESILYQLTGVIP